MMQRGGIEVKQSLFGVPQKKEQKLTSVDFFEK